MVFHSPVKRARLLAMLLLAAIAWVSTVEFTHNHGPKAKSGESLSSTVQSASDEEATQISSSSTNGPASNSRSNADCLICQLHQNLSASEISHTPGLEPTESLRLNTPTIVIAQLSEFISTGHGRAPPSIL
jgi:hypothetical protein